MVEDPLMMNKKKAGALTMPIESAQKALKIEEDEEEKSFQLHNFT